MAGRAWAPSLTWIDLDQLSRRTPFLANIRPSGKFPMEDFLPVPAGFRGLLHRMDGSAAHGLSSSERPDAEGRTSRMRSSRTTTRWIVPRDRPLGPRRGRGGAAGAIWRRTAPLIKLHNGRGSRRRSSMPDLAVVFRDFNDMDARIVTIRRFPVTPDPVLVSLQNVGRSPWPGIEWGMLPIPKKIRRAGRSRHGPGVSTPA